MKEKTTKTTKKEKKRKKIPQTETELYIRHAKGRRKKEQQQKLHLYFALNKITSGQPEPEPKSELSAQLHTLPKWG